MTAPGEYHVRAVDRVARLLTALAEGNGSQTLSAVAKKADLPVATALRFLRTLEDHHLVTCSSDDRQYRLGFRLLELSHSLLRQLDIHELARPQLTAVRDLIDETASLSVRQGDHHVVVATVEAFREFRRIKQIGRALPLYFGASGKVFLAAGSDEELRAYVERTTFEQHSPRTPTAQTLPGMVTEVRNRGFCISRDESGQGGLGISVPVRDSSGQVIATFDISAMLVRFTPETEELWSRAAIRAASAISRALGFPGASPLLEPAKSSPPAVDEHAAP